LIGTSSFVSILSSINSQVNYSAYSQILGGLGHRISTSAQSVILGGYSNIIGTSSRSSIIGSKYSSICTSQGSTIEGGTNNLVCCCVFDSSIIAGCSNTICGYLDKNEIQSCILNSGIFSGCSNKIEGDGSNSISSAIISGYKNLLQNSENSVIIGGCSNYLLYSQSSSILSGTSSYISSSTASSIISGGYAQRGKSTVGSCILQSQNSTIIGPASCIVSSNCSVIVGWGLTLSNENDVLYTSCLKVKNVNLSTGSGSSTCMLIHETNKYLTYRTLGSVASEVIDFFSVANTATASASAADTYLVSLPISGFIKSGTYYVIRFTGSKTAAGVATPVFSVRIGTLGTTADTAVLTFTGAAQTAAADNFTGEIRVVVTNYGTTSILLGSIFYTHNNSTTGIANRQVVSLNSTSSSTNLTTSSLRIGLSVNPGAAGVWTFHTLMISAGNPGP